MALYERHDIILMDLEMPLVDGWEATRRLKANPQTRDIPVIALSAHALAGEREKALAAGCNEFDPKPIDFERRALARTAPTHAWRTCKAPISSALPHHTLALARPKTPPRTTPA